MDDGQMSVLEYARACGLCRDYSCEPPLLHLSDHDTTWNLATDLNGPIVLPPLELSNTRLEDVWEVDTSTAIFLKDAVKHSPTIQDAIYAQLSQGVKHLRMEQPLLQNDAELEYNKFIAREKVQRPADLRTISRSLDLDAEIDHNDFEWPLMDDCLLQRVQAKLHMEKLQITTGALELIKDVASPFQLPCEDEVDDFKISRSRLSSPILPLSPAPSLDFFENDQGTNQVPLASSPDDPATLLLKALNDRILLEPIDGLSPNPNKGELDCRSPFDPSCWALEALDRHEPSSSSTIKRANPEDLKMEPPLTPQTAYSSPFKKIKLEEIVTDNIPRWGSHSSSGSSSVERQYNKFFDEMLDLSGPVIHAIENEQLDEADSTLRMPVPAINDDQVLAPWNMFSAHKGKTCSEAAELKSQRRLLQLLKDCMTPVELKWSHRGLHSMSWTPIPPVNCANVVNDILEMGEVAIYFAELFIDDVDQESFSWKRPGLRLLDEDEEDEMELEVMQIDISDEVDLAWLARNQKLVAPPAVIDRGDSSTGTATDSHLPSLFTPSAASNALDLFFDIAEGSTTFKQASKPIHAPKPTSHQPHPEQASSTTPVTPPVPTFNSTLAPPYLVLSTNILSSRTLVSTLRILLPQTLLIERALPPATEADILPATRTGLILTTLQKLKQLPLPGSSSTTQNTVRARIAALSSRYATLVVLVASPAVQLDDSDITALNDVTLLAARTQCSVRAVLVCCSSRADKDAVMAHWAAAQVCACQAGVIQCMETGHGDMQVEHQAEVALRAAGLDAFAALAVVQTVRGVAGDEGVMAWLACCGPGRRYTLLAPVVGIEAVRRVNALLDSGWDEVLA